MTDELVKQTQHGRYFGADENARLEWILRVVGKISFVIDQGLCKSGDLAAIQGAKSSVGDMHHRSEQS